jgi:hypothetical protein
MCVLQAPELSAVMLGEDVAAMQQMLKSAYQVMHPACQTAIQQAVTRL